MASRRIFPPVTMAEVLADIMALSDDEFDAIDSEVKSPDAFDAGSERCTSIAEKLGLDRESVGYLLSFLEFIYSRVNKDDPSDEIRSEMIDKLFSTVQFEQEPNESDEAQANSIARLKKRLLQLTAYNPNAKIRNKVDRLKKGFLPNAVAFSTFVDLRPIIDDERERISGYVAILQLRISTEQSDKEEFTVVQLDPKALNKLSEAIDDAKRKLALLDSDDFLAPRIMNR